MSHLRIFSVTALIAIASAEGAGFASAASITDRDSAYVIKFPAGLDSAVTSYTVSLTLPANGTNQSSTTSFKTGNLGVTFNTSGGVTTTYANVPAGTPSETGALVNNGSGGTFGFNYTTNNGPNFTSSWTQSEVSKGYHVLAFGGDGSQGFGGGGSNFVDIGGIFTVEAFIQGDFTLGNHTGGVYLTNISPGYNVISNFVYNSGLGYTLFSASTGNYDGTNPEIAFNLVGLSAVPLPASLPLFGAAILCLGAVGYGIKRTGKAQA